jgi:hypothetical protein
MNIQEMKAAIAAKQAERNNSLAERIEMMQLSAQLKRLNDPKVLEAEASLGLVKDTTDFLNALINKCKEITLNVKVFNIKTNENRKWQPRKELRYGNHIALVTELLYGVQYACKEHKDLMLEATGLSTDLVESALNALGSPSYFNKHMDEIVEESSYDYQSFTQALTLLENQWGIIFNTLDFSEKKMEDYFISQANKADKEKKAHNKTTLIASNLISI